MAGAKTNKRKRNGLSNAPNSKTAKVVDKSPLSPPCSDTNEPRNLSTLISEEEIEVTVDTLLTLAEHPSVIKSKPCKSLRAAVFDFRQACTTGVNTAPDANLTARISAAITDGKYVDALITLAEMRIRNEAPKLGALCRWVRDLDVISGVYMQTSAAASRTTSDMERLRVLDSILRVTGPSDVNFDKSDLLVPNPIVQREMWDLRDSSRPRLPIRQRVLDGTIFKSQPQSAYREKFKTIETTPGPERKPPNFHPAVIYLTDENTIPLLAQQDTQSITYHPHPHVPSLSLLHNVLSPSECTSIIAATEAIGYLPDAPVPDAGVQTSILAHNVYWLTDVSFHNVLWARVAPHLPTHLDGRKAKGLNRRFRVYRYIPGATYRAHIDGAWPPSGVNPSTGGYVYDASPASGKQSSLFTFLIYLNDEFEGGETTFFVPSVREGVLNAYPVKPVMGSVAVFPHGEARGALLHEGTGVVEGAKYIIRTDVEFDVEATGVVES